MLLADASSATIANLLLWWGFWQLKSPLFKSNFNLLWEMTKSTSQGAWVDDHHHQQSWHPAGIFDMHYCIQIRQKFNSFVQLWVISASWCPVTRLPMFYEMRQNFLVRSYDIPHCKNPLYSYLQNDSDSPILSTFT